MRLRTEESRLNIERDLLRAEVSSLREENGAMGNVIAMHASPPTCPSCPTLTSTISHLQTQVKLLQSQAPTLAPAPPCPRCITHDGEDAA